MVHVPSSLLNMEILEDGSVKFDKRVNIIC